MDPLIRRLALDETIQEFFLVANTPQFLLRKLRDSSLVRAVSELYTADELAAFIRSERETFAERDSIEVYILLVALALQNTDEAFDEIAKTELSFGQWSEAIRRILLEDFTSTNAEQAVIERDSWNDLQEDSSEDVFQTIGDGSWK